MIRRSLDSEKVEVKVIQNLIIAKQRGAKIIF
jgi:hypothetical protein